MRASYIGRGCNTSNGLQEFVKVSLSSIKATQENSTRLVIQRDGRPVFFCDDNSQQLMGVKLGDKPKMGLVGLALLGVALGAAGTEFLRVKRPDIIEKVEDAARRFVDSVCPSKSDDEKTKEK